MRDDPTLSARAPPEVGKPFAEVHQFFTEKFFGLRWQFILVAVDLHVVSRHIDHSHTPFDGYNA